MVPSAQNGSSRLMAQLRRGVLEFCVLAMLESEERYAFDLVRALGDVDGMMVTSEGTLYPMLARLRKDGAVDSTWQESAAGPPRRYYRLTPQGARALGEFRTEWARFRDAVDRVLKEG
jgi:PadR family transcriptional regulator PadR